MGGGEIWTKGKGGIMQLYFNFKKLQWLYKLCHYQWWNAGLCIPSCLKTNTHSANKQIGHSLFCAGCFTAPLWEEWREWQALDSAKEATPGSEARQRGGHCGRSIRMDVFLHKRTNTLHCTHAYINGMHGYAYTGMHRLHRHACESKQKYRVLPCWSLLVNWHLTHSPRIF